MNKTGSDSVLSTTDTVQLRKPFPIFSRSQKKELDQRIKDLAQTIKPSLEHQLELLQLKYRSLGHCFEVDRKDLNFNKYQLSLCEEKLGQEQSCHAQMVKNLKAEIQELKKQNKEKLNERKQEVNEWKQEVDEFKKQQEKLNALLAIQGFKDQSLNESTKKLKEENQELKNSLKRTRDMLEASMHESLDRKDGCEKANQVQRNLTEQLEKQQPQLKRLKEETEVKDKEIVSLRRKLNLAQKEIQKLQSEKDNTEPEDIIEFF